MDEREKMARGLLYDANHNPDLIKERAACKDMCFAYNSLRPSDEEGKRKIAERLFGRIGRAFSVLAPFYCDYGYNIFCGDDFFANHNCVMLDGAKITFGEHVYIAPNCCFATAGHPLDAGQRAAEVEGKGQKESGVRMFYTGWSASTGEADWALSPLFASQNWPPTLFNTAFYSNKQVDDFLAQALKTNDPAEKTRLYKAAQDIIWQESPWIPLVVEKLVSAHSKNLTGFWIMPDTGFSFEDADLQ